MLERLAPDATLVVIDTNKSFIDYLGKTIHDSRLQRCLGSAAGVQSILAGLGFDHADYVLSGLPFSTLPPGVGDEIARETRGGPAAGRGVPRLSVQSARAELPRAPFRADRR